MHAFGDGQNDSPRMPMKTGDSPAKEAAKEPAVFVVASLCRCAASVSVAIVCVEFFAGGETAKKQAIID
ncbi:MAG: hypothetical protein ACKOTB_10120, partial [Planctomycetia bacterium]